MFGYSRGACRCFSGVLLPANVDHSSDVVRAVAGLLHNIRAITSDSVGFKKDYQEGLEVFQDLTREGGPKKPGQVSRHWTAFDYPS